MTAVSVDKWVRGLRRRQRWQRALRQAMPWLAAVLVAWASARLVFGSMERERPAAADWLPWLASLAAGVVVCAAVWPRPTPWQRIDESLELGGKLETFVGRGGAACGPMHGWLERELAATMPAAAASGRLLRLGWLPVRPLRSSIVLLALLLLLGLILPPFPDGVLPLGAGGAGGGQGGAGDTADASPTEVEAPSTGDAAAVDGPSPAQEPPEAEAPPASLPPQALMDAAETRDAVVVPSFVGEGEGTPTQSPVVDVEVAQGAQGSSAFRERPVPGRGASPAEPVGDPSDPEFVRAAEAAQRSRHVPPPERAFVRRWFQVGGGGGR